MSDADVFAGAGTPCIQPLPRDLKLLSEGSGMDPDGIFFM